MSKYDELRTLSFQFTDEVKEQGIWQTFYTLNFPVELKQKLHKLYLEHHSSKKYKNSNLPVTSLNKTLRALVPDLISIVSGVGSSNHEGAWLYSNQHIKPEPLRLIFDAWIKAEFTKVPETELDETLSLLQTSTLQWEEKKLNLAEYGREKNSTAKLVGDLFLLVPDFFASLLSKPDITLERGQERLQFRRMPLAPAYRGVSGAEVVSWPPMGNAENNSLWSVVIGLRLQTIPFHPIPILNLELGVRRWVTAPKAAGKGNSSVALLTEVPWLKGVHQSNSFQVAPIRWKPSSSGDGTQFDLIWADKLPVILASLQLQHPFPDANTINLNPEAVLNLAHSPNAALLYHTRMNITHKIGQGFMPGDRQPLALQLADLFAPQLKFTDTCKRVSEYKPSPSPNPFQEEESPEVYAKRRRLLKEAVGNVLRLEIHYQSDKIRDALINAICNFLGITPQNTDKSTWDTAEIRIELSVSNLGEIGRELDLPTKANSGKTKALQSAIEQRVQEIKRTLPESSDKIACFIELADKEGFRNNTDPKHAVRIGFAHTNRLTQFITPPKNRNQDLEHRAKAAFLDMLRQLGVQAEERAKAFQGLPQKLNYLGVWLVKHQAKTSPTRKELQLPVFVLQTSDRSKILVKVPGLNWKPYPDALLAIAQALPQGFDDYKEKPKIMAFVQETLDEVIGDDDDTLLLCDAQNIRSVWKWLQNPKMSLNKISFFEGENPRPITDFPGLRVVRLRGNEETPQWYADNQKEVGFSKGLFSLPNSERVFASTYGKPKQFQKLIMTQSKLTGFSSTRSDKTFSPMPQDYAWNPCLYEITLACLQPGDEPWQWAAITHELRDIAFHHDEPTALPLPLHLAKQIKEYTLPLPESEEDT